MTYTGWIPDVSVLHLLGVQFHLLHSYAALQPPGSRKVKSIWKSICSMPVSVCKFSHKCSVVPTHIFQRGCRSAFFRVSRVINVHQPHWQHLRIVCSGQAWAEGFDAPYLLGVLQRRVFALQHVDFSSSFITKCKRGSDLECTNSLISSGCERHTIPFEHVSLRNHKKTERCLIAWYSR